MSSNNALEDPLGGVRDNLCVYTVIALEDAEDDCLTACPPSSLAPYPLGTEVGLIDFDVATERCLGIASLYQSVSDFEKDGVYRPMAEACQLRGWEAVRSRAKAAYELPESGLRNPRTAIVLVKPRYDNKLAA